MKNDRRTRSVLLIALIVVFVVWAGLCLTGAWRQTMLREAYLPQLEVAARRSQGDGPLNALLGLRELQAGLPQAPSTLIHAIAAGEHRQFVWQAIALYFADQGDLARASLSLRRGQRDLSGRSPALDAALVRLGSLGPQPTSEQMAAAVCPAGVESLVAPYTTGSFLNPVVDWWGHRRPNSSGFTTRMLWAQAQPDNAQAQRLWGLALLTNRRIPEAVAVLVHVVSMAPGSAAAHLALAQALEAEGGYFVATNEYLASLALDPDSVSALLGFGRDCQLIKVKYARLAYLRAVKLDPSCADAWIGIGVADLYNTGLQPECLGAFQTAAHLAPQRTDFFDSYAITLSANAQSDKAESLLRRRLAQAPADAEAHFRLGGVLLTDNPTPSRLAEAEKETRAAQALAPGQSGIDLQLGEILLREGQVTAAIAALKKSAAEDSTSAGALRMLARAYMQAGQVSLAQQATARAQTLSMEQERYYPLVAQQDTRYFDPEYHRELIAVYREEGQKDAVAHEEQVLKALETEPAIVIQGYRATQANLRKVFGAAVTSESGS